MSEPTFTQDQLVCVIKALGFKPLVQTDTGKPGETLEAKYEDLEAMYADLEAKYEALKAKYEAQKAKYEDLEAKNSALENKIKSQTDENNPQQKYDLVKATTDPTTNPQGTSRQFGITEKGENVCMLLGTDPQGLQKGEIDNLPLKWSVSKKRWEVYFPHLKWDSDRDCWVDITSPYLDLPQAAPDTEDGK
jgi:hypothetical protein